MDFTNEPYVRLYTRDTLTWKRFNWQAKAIVPLLFRRLDRSGTLDLDGMDPVGAVAIASELPPEVIAEGLPKLLELGVLELRGDFLVAPRFLEAQECIKSDKLRAREYRERKRSQVMAEPSRNVTNRHATNETSRGVTLSCSSLSELSIPERESARAPARDDQQWEERRADAAREDDSRFGQPPPNLAAPKPKKADWVRVQELFAERLGLDITQLAVDRDSADRVASAARAESGADDAAFEAVVRQLLNLWQNDSNPRARKHLLSNMALHITKYAMALKALKPAPLKVVPPPEDELPVITPEEHARNVAAVARSFGIKFAPLEVANA
jgi:hypothetical protein